MGHQGTTATSRELLADDRSRAMIDRASGIAATAPWLITALFAGRIKDVHRILENLASVDRLLMAEKSVHDLLVGRLSCHPSKLSRIASYPATKPKTKSSKKARIRPFLCVKVRLII